ncbi:MAG: hypothetical protein FJW26_01700 [Acidimicrobiia bacterium]|nr:hypothetical protein [Acidimicrobiia bacterium]
MRPGLTRRQALKGTVAGLAASSLGFSRAFAETHFEISMFRADITPPLGHALMGGGITPARRIDDPLWANGFVLKGGELPIVLVSLDWCEVRNDAYDRWRAVLAKAAGTRRERVLLSCIHQHDAPIADLTAQRLLNEAKAAGSICDLEFHELAVQRVAQALQASRGSPRRVTHLGLGQAKVEKVASNRRYVGPDGKLLFNRTSATRDAWIRAQPEGTVDPWLKTLSFWDGEQPVLALSRYATHPMSYYGKGGVSSDFMGMARQRRQQEDPGVKQIYVSGCSGNVTAGRYNDGAPENRPVLADRIHQAMTAAWKNTRRQPLAGLRFRSLPLILEPRNDAGFSEVDLETRLRTDPKPFGQCLAALGLSWQRRSEAGRAIDVPVVDFGSAQLLLLPGEMYVEFQLMAQQLRPDSFVMAVGYGECAPGYVPIERAFEENDTNLKDWCWVGPGSEARVTQVLRRALVQRA